MFVRPCPCSQSFPPRALIVGELPRPRIPGHSIFVGSHPPGPPVLGLPPLGGGSPQKSAGRSECGSTPGISCWCAILGPTGATEGSLEESTSKTPPNRRLLAVSGAELAPVALRRMRNNSAPKANSKPMSWPSRCGVAGPHQSSPSRMSCWSWFHGGPRL